MFGSEYSSIKEYWCVSTLVDITPTGVRKGNSKEHNQQRNRDTLMQTVGMFAQPYDMREYFDAYFASTSMWISSRSAHVTTLDISEKVYWISLPTFSFVQIKWGNSYHFADKILGTYANFWNLVFGVETPDAFGTGGELLIKALDQVPIITGLDDNVRFDRAVFDNSEDNRNYIVTKLSASGD